MSQMGDITSNMTTKKGQISFYGRFLGIHIHTSFTEELRQNLPCSRCYVNRCKYAV